MVTAQQELGLIRPKIVSAVDRLTREGLSTMDAYATLGGQIGKSARWVRKVIGRDVTAGIRLRDAINIQAAYERLCDCVDAAADAAEARNDELRRQIDAALGEARPTPVRLGGLAPAEAAAARGPGQAAASAPVPPSPGPGASVAADLNDLPLWRAMTEE